MIVVDASAAVDLLLRRAPAGEIERIALLSGEALLAPSVIDAEVLGALRRLLAAGELDVGRAEQALDDLLAMALQLHEPRALLPRAWDLRENLAAMDALYVALAEVAGARLLTTDARAARAVSDRTDVEVVVPAG